MDTADPTLAIVEKIIGKTGKNRPFAVVTRLKAPEVESPRSPSGSSPPAREAKRELYSEMLRDP